MNKSQISAEFMIFLGLALLLMVVILAKLFAVDIKQASSKREELLLKSTGIRIQNEINIAAQVEDGYIRHFETPEDLENTDYNIDIRGYVLTLWTDNAVFAFPIPNVTGAVSKGENNITKFSGQVYVNSIPPTVTAQSTCQNAQDGELCYGLDLVFGCPYQYNCCAEHGGLCCSPPPTPPASCS